ncbi:response regulator [Stenotrophomonas maltophilia]|uniref:ATP-binding protein n=1 Tax=Stenotrophomonas maltophilia TaxID=40324 RepID=UPI0015E033D6|nr:ATP-binding protein [Stenotrophomonas maltophilia]MBA0280446.1 response regulator [Stenotrophomonas maltophilia]MBA0345821.1 response regulator [Stenotrophomonas maltophilia]MBA0358970.1 response regulator [Stenotrophomonas maltophilia]MBA0521089.1 response regulator [Stenotrophomonas maltophilia]
MASPTDSVLATLRHLQRRVLFGGGAILTVLLLAAGAAALWLRLETVHQEERDALRRGLQTVDRYIGERRRAYVASLNTNTTLWATQQPVLVARGMPLAERLAAQQGQVQVLAPGALSVPWLAVSPPQRRLAPQAQAAFLGMVETYSAYMAATVAAQDSPTSLISYTYEPEGRLFAVAGLQDEAQLLRTMGMQTREQALAALRRTADEGWQDAGTGTEIALPSGRLRVYYGRNPFTGQDALVTQMRLRSEGTPFAHRLTFEPLHALHERLTEAAAGGWQVVDRQGRDVLHATATEAPPASQPLNGNHRFEVSAPLRGVDWVLVRSYRWTDVWATQRVYLLAAALMLAVLLGALWAVLLRVDRRVLRPALEQAARVHESEALSRSLIETSPVGLCLLDQQSGQLILHNQALEQLAASSDHGLTALVQHLLQDVGSRDQGQPFQAPADDGGTPPRFLRSIVAASRYQQRAIWVFAVTDVTAQEETRQRLLDARHHAEQARHDAEAADHAKTAFVAMISHEIRTPLSGVLGHLELLARQPMAAVAQEHAARARAAAGVLQWLVNDTLDLSRIEAGLMQLEPVTFDPRALLRQTATLFGPQAAAKGVQLVVQSADTVAAAYHADAHRLAQIINNFVGNALKFTDAGTVTIRVDARGRPDGTEGLRFEVCDTGPGIAAEDQATLFTPFVQADAGRQHGGSGLGLALCQRFAELMGGTVGVDSTPGSGSCFHVEVPATHATAVASTSPTVNPAVGAQLPGGHALLVDDSVISRDVTLAQLQALGWRVTTATDGIEAWECWRDGRFDLVLTDLNMPRMDGYALARRLCADNARVPIVALTASALPDDAERARAAGVMRLLLKPLDLDALQAALHSIDLWHAVPTAATPLMSDAVLAQMRDAFLKTARRDLDSLRQAMDMGDSTAMTDLLHSFAGALVFLGQKDAAQACQRAEQSLQATGAADAVAMASVVEAIAWVTTSVEGFETPK